MCWHHLLYADSISFLLQQLNAKNSEKLQKIAKIESSERIEKFQSNFHWNVSFDNIKSDKI